MSNKLSKIDFNDYKPLREVIFNSIREAIILGELKPGERLMEVQLAEKLGVSRTPIREAIRKLELEGLVVMIPRKGAYVADLTKKDIIDVLEVRAALDGLATQLAAERITDNRAGFERSSGKQRSSGDNKRYLCRYVRNLHTGKRRRLRFKKDQGLGGKRKIVPLGKQD
jgi:DNA-binding transcriptional regulator YhcF (GntR family)